MNIEEGIASIERRLSPELSFCKKCKRPWDCVTCHSTNYLEGRGCFPLCQSCWESLTPDERLPFYRELWEGWELVDDDEPTWEQLKYAVLNEESEQMTDMTNEEIDRLICMSYDLADEFELGTEETLT